MVEDVVKALGYLTLGTRLKRIGERLQTETQEIISSFEDTEISAANNPVLVSLYRLGPSSIGTLSKAIGHSQPGITRMVNHLKKVGLVETHKDPGDGRISLIVLTKKGIALTERQMETVWPLIEQAVQNACANLSGDLLAQLGQLETALARRPLPKRLRVRVKAGS
ncbi:MAG: winged helix-turn-helix transcriptional regulator [Rhodobacteraceae bacterium]|nr:winged helix-turn-helix transcriptional regulator [Paracoccaceae bacterium]